MKTVDPHDPDPDFVRQLEWQLRTEVRRQGRFERTRGGVRAPLVLAAILAALALGFAGATVAQEYGNRAHTRYLRLQAEGAVELTRMRLEYAREMLDEMVAAGEDENSLASMRWELGRIRFELQRARLELDEISTSGASPRHELTAPLIDGRDFVLERLRLESERLQSDELRLVSFLAEAADPEMSRGVEAELARLQADLERVEGEIELRERFLVDASSAEKILQQQRVAQAQARVLAADVRVGHIEQYLRSVQERMDRGEADRLELRSAEFELAQARIEARLARAQRELAGEAVR